jgi:FkbM family methyltransferase
LKNYLIYGANSSGEVAFDILKQRNCNVIGFIDKLEVNQNELLQRNYPTFENIYRIPPNTLTQTNGILIAVGRMETAEQLRHELSKQLPSIPTETVFDDQYREQYEQLMVSKEFLTQQEVRVRPWFRIDGDKTLRLDYDLDENSIIFDLGGYEGQWSSDIFSKYCSTIYIFEPVPEFSEKIQSRFIKNPKLKVFSFGLASSNNEEQISLLKDGSSVFKKGETVPQVHVRFRKIDEFLKEFNVSRINLMKINIEGGEYDLLEYMINSEIIEMVENIQVQFHDFVPWAEKRMKGIQSQLMRTHELTYQFEFVWENWKKTQKF